MDDGFVHEIFKPIVNSGFAFSAKRWFSILAQHCALMAPCHPIVGGGKKIFLYFGFIFMYYVVET